MALRIADIACAFLLVLGAALLLLAASPSVPAAEGGACNAWGDTNPERLSNREARDAVLCLINNERQRHGLPALDRNKKLQKAAQRHSERMDGSGCFSHQCSGESGLDDRLASVGYLRGGLLRWAYGENIAWGLEHRGTPSAVVDAWMGSSGHRGNILNHSFKDIGVGFSPGTPQSENAPGGIYTVDFGLAVG
jgi:uncharacterized protein YkwD